MNQRSAIGLLLTAMTTLPALAQKPALKLASNPNKTVSSKSNPAPTARRFKALSSHVNLGISWLVKHQLPGGAWGQGDEAEGMRGSGGAGSETPSVADTCLAGLALLRSGSTPGAGTHSRSLSGAVKYVCSEIEESDKDSLFITRIRNTRIQAKLGQYIDTFLASQLLAEVKGKCGSPALEERVKKAFHKVMDKIERHQSSTGTWEKDGWAPVISQSIAAKAVNRGAQAGLKVPAQTLARVEKNARASLDAKQIASAGTGVASGPVGSFSKSSRIASGKAAVGEFAGAMGGGSAGVPLYYLSSNLGALQESVNTYKARESQLRQQAEKGKTADERKNASKQLQAFGAAKRDLNRAQTDIAAKLEDKNFVAGFGSNGGEEFISYMNLGESLVTKGGKEWDKWDHWVTSNLNRIQNPDGSWTGHHCITGRTSCTAAALLTLMVDRSPMPIAKAVARR